MKDDKGQSKGFGFVCFKTGDSAAKAVKKHQQVVEGKHIYVVKAVKKDDRRQQLLKENSKRHVFIKGFGKSNDESAIYMILDTNDYEYESVIIAKDEKGNSKGYGFIVFKHARQAENFIEECNE